MLLGQRILEHDEATTRTRVSFDAKAEFENPAGFIQGGILTAMLDDTMGPAIWLATGGTMFPVTINMNVSFLAATRRGSIFGEARVRQLGRTIAFLEAQLTDEDKKLLACATASVRLVKPGFANESQS